MPLKIKIFDKPEPDETPTLMLNTRVTPGGTFEVFACDGVGEPLPGGLLWKLLPGGRQVLCSGIRPDLGLDRDGAGKIRNI